LVLVVPIFHMYLRDIHYLKVPKCEHCELSFFTLSDTIWIGDIGDKVWLQRYRLLETQ
jgi:hypothetical protein